MPISGSSNPAEKRAFRSWFRPRPCLEMLMRWAGYDEITQLTDEADQRPIYLCVRKGGDA